MVDKKRNHGEDFPGTKKVALAIPISARVFAVLLRKTDLFVHLCGNCFGFHESKEPVGMDLKTVTYVVAHLSCRHSFDNIGIVVLGEEYGEGPELDYTSKEARDMLRSLTRRSGH